jgi:hypothetical protein
MGLTPKLAANWPALSPLLDEALELPENERPIWLATYSNKTSHPNVLKARMALARAFAGVGQIDRAIEMEKESIKGASSLFGPTCRMVGLDLERLARIQVGAGRWREAAQNIERSISILKEHYASDSPAFASLLRLRDEIRARVAGSRR